MLVFISDVHLTDGSVCPTISPGAIHYFVQQLRELCSRASWRAGGKYDPIQNVDVILLGDTLDITTSSHWLTDNVQPWSSGSFRDLAAKTDRIVERILAQNAATLNQLSSLCNDNVVRLLPSRSGNPTATSDAVSVQVRLHYMVGDHDWLLHHPASDFDVIRKKVAERLGMFDRSGSPFPHAPSESERVQSILQRHRVFARHGDIHDRMSFGGQRDASSINELITISLLAAFVKTAKEEFSELAPIGFCELLEDIFHVRPLMLTPSWLENLMFQVSLPEHTKHHIRRIWNQHVATVTDSEFAQQLQAEMHPGFLSRMRDLLVLKGQNDASTLQRCLSWCNSIGACSEESMMQMASEEVEFLNRRASHIVYGHTHHDSRELLDVCNFDGKAFPQFYLNTGTWRKVMQMSTTSRLPRFVGFESLQLVAFYEDDERMGRPFEVVRGELGVVPSSSQGQSAVNEAKQRKVPKPHFGFGAPNSNPARSDMLEL